MNRKGLIASLTTGLYQDKYKVFCRGIKTASDFHSDLPLVDHSKQDNSYFILVENTEDNHPHLTKYLNTDIIKNSVGTIFENVAVIPPYKVIPLKTSPYATIPHYFTVNETGDIIEIPEDQLKIFDQL